MTKKVNNIVNSCNEIKELLLWHGEMLRNTNIDYQTRLENDLYFKEKVFKILHRIKRATWRGENKKSYEWKQMGYQVKVKDGVGTFEPLPTKQETRKHFYNKEMVCISCGCSKNAAESMKWDCKDVIKPNVSY